MEVDFIGTQTSSPEMRLLFNSHKSKVCNLSRGVVQSVHQNASTFTSSKFKPQPNRKLFKSRNMSESGKYEPSGGSWEEELRRS